jgi:hypothetical protein
LPVVHHLHEALNDVPVDAPVPPELVARYDAPVIASALKLWLLELDQPIAMWEGWDEIRKIYPSGECSVAQNTFTPLLRIVHSRCRRTSGGGGSQDSPWSVTKGQPSGLGRSHKPLERVSSSTDTVL